MQPTTTMLPSTSLSNTAYTLIGNLSISVSTNNNQNPPYTFYGIVKINKYINNYRYILTIQLLDKLRTHYNYFFYYYNKLFLL